MSRNLTHAMSGSELATTADPVCCKSEAEAAVAGSPGFFYIRQE